MAVLRASGNRCYAQLTGLIATALRFSIGATNRYKGVQLASVADHKRAADAVLAGMSQLAEDSMSKLVEEAIDPICAQKPRLSGRRGPASTAG